MVRYNGIIALSLLSATMNTGAAAAGEHDWQAYRLAAAEQLVAGEAQRWQQQYRLEEQRRLRAQQAAGQAQREQLRQRLQQRQQDRSGVSLSASNAVSAAGMSGRKVGR